MERERERTDLNHTGRVPRWCPVHDRQVRRREEEGGGGRTENMLDREKRFIRQAFEYFRDYDGLSFFYSPYWAFLLPPFSISLPPPPFSVSTKSTSSSSSPSSFSSRSSSSSSTSSHSLAVIGPSIIAGGDLQPQQLQTLREIYQLVEVEPLVTASQTYNGHSVGPATRRSSQRTTS